MLARHSCPVSNISLLLGALAGGKRENAVGLELAHDPYYKTARSPECRKT